MNLQEYIFPFLTYFLMLPGTLVCFAPARNHMRIPFRKAALRIAGVTAVISAVMAFVTVYFSQEWGILYFPGMLIVFMTFHRASSLHISQSAFLFILICSFMSFISNAAIVFGALLHPDGLLMNMSVEGHLVVLIASLLFCGLVIRPSYRYGSFIIDNLPSAQVWWTASIVAGLFFIFAQVTVIRKYRTLHTNRVGSAYIAILILMFILLFLLCIVFYHIVEVMVERAEAESRNQMIEMQEKQYESLQRYIDSRVRHDFRQTIYTLKELSAEKDYASIEEFLRRYVDALPQKDTEFFCRDNALNALLNHYSRQAKEQDTKLKIEVGLPEKLEIDSVDLCSIIGNILENAMIACVQIPAARRFVNLIISVEQGDELYIAASNGFNGKVLQRGNRYLSTHKGGNGIGLVSVAATAGRYSGTADFTHDSKVFYSNVMLVNKPAMNRYITKA